MAKNVFEERGRNIEEEVKQYPLSKLDLLSTSSNSGAKVYNRCTENIFRIFQNHPDYKGRFRFDTWTQKAEILKDSSGSSWMN